LESLPEIQLPGRKDGSFPGATLETLQGEESARGVQSIPFLRPNLVKKDSYIKYLGQIDESRWYSNYGPLNTIFERRVLTEIFDNVGAAVTVNNATTGLILAISLSKRAGGRYALMPSFTFPATPLAALWCGLTPYFVDILKDSWVMNENQVERALKKLGDEVAVIVPYATFGTCLDLSYYRSLYEGGFPVVIDAAASFGTVGGGGQFGKGFLGAVVYSFHATKAFGIGEGGLVYSGHPGLIQAIRQGSNFGFSGERETVIFGLNGKLPEYAAAVALATLEDFPRKISARRDIYQRYVALFEKEGMFARGWVMQKSEGEIPNQFVPALCPDGKKNGYFVERLMENHIEARTYFCPTCHEQAQFVSCPSTTLTVTEKISKRIISLPLFEEMEIGDVSRIVRTLRKADD
jgi:dTDP-4-amino-4,6-dideoxygalactose transaminase